MENAGVACLDTIDRSLSDPSGRRQACIHESFISLGLLNYTLGLGRKFPFLSDAPRLSLYSSIVLAKPCRVLIRVAF